LGSIRRPRIARESSAPAIALRSDHLHTKPPIALSALIDLLPPPCRPRCGGFGAAFVRQVIRQQDFGRAKPRSFDKAADDADDGRSAVPARSVFEQARSDSAEALRRLVVTEHQIGLDSVMTKVRR
jgi:hypothetical protein